MKKLANIQPIETCDVTIQTLAEIHKSGTILTIMEMVKKYLPQDDCALIAGNLFHLEAINAVHKAMNLYADLQLEQICGQCEFKYICSFKRRN